MATAGLPLKQLILSLGVFQVAVYIVSIGGPETFILSVLPILIAQVFDHIFHAHT